MKKFLFLLLPFLSSCSDYQQGNLREQTSTIEYNQSCVLSNPEKLFTPITITEDVACDLALRFNPSIRLQVVRNRGWSENEVELRGLLNPEIQINNTSASLILNVNVIGLYNILSSDERAAWNRMRQAEKNRSLADQNQLAIILVRNVRLSFLECARLKASIPILEAENGNLMRYAFQHKLEQDPLFLLTKAELNERIVKTENEISEALSLLIQFVGAKPSQSLSFNFSGVLDPSLPSLSLPELLTQAFSYSFTLKSLANRYEEQDYNVREAWKDRFGSLYVGPAINLQPGASSIGLSIKARTLWPSIASDNIKEAEDLRDRIGAEYTQAKHKIEAEVSQLFHSMLTRYLSITTYSPVLTIESIDEKKTTHYEYLEIMRRVNEQSLYHIDEIAHYKMNEIMLESLIGTSVRK